MGPDLPGMLLAIGAIAAVLTVFALVDRLVCGAWDALLGSPGSSLVAGISTWQGRTEPRRTTSSEPVRAG